MAEKKKFKLNIIDIIVIIVLIAALAFAGFKLFIDRGDSSSIQDKELSYTLEFFCEESPEYAVNLVKVGDKLVDEYMDIPLGEVTKVEVGPSVSYATDAEGNWNASAKPGYSSIKITTEVQFKGSDYAHGLQIDTFKYGVGHSMTFRVGQAKLYGRIAGIEKH